MKSPSSRISAGFTLIELLTVIAIIGILAAILIPTVGTVRAKAAQTKSQSNLRQLAGAMVLFANENKGVFPHAQNNPGYNSWDWPLRTYLSVSNYKGSAWENLFLHPRDPAPAPPADKARRTYAMNAAQESGKRVGVGSKSSTLPSENISKIATPSRVILLTERPNSAGSYVGDRNFSDVLSPDQMSANMVGQPNLNPGGRYNFAFADGHVAVMAPQDTVGTGSVSAPRGMWTVADGD